jgi:hypothetical protein
MSRLSVHQFLQGPTTRKCCTCGIPSNTNYCGSCGNSTVRVAHPGNAVAQPVFQYSQPVFQYQQPVPQPVIQQPLFQYSQGGPKVVVKYSQGGPKVVFKATQIYCNAPGCTNCTSPSQTTHFCKTCKNKLLPSCGQHRARDCPWN